ncbi:hypothetical protein E6H34_00270 [Candidatus Bathyarchaeota archaeon]|nr:MAG: hypothetical protein E6H34_00270 [Candidatus Bathyarchaeota archaeon]
MPSLRPPSASIETRTRRLPSSTGTSRYSQCGECSHGTKSACLEKKCKCCHVVMAAVRATLLHGWR